MRVRITILLLMMWGAASAQNFVPNPGFEEFKRCPYYYNTASGTFGAPDWNSPTQGTPDYFNECSTSESGIPENWAGNAKAHGGKAYAGIHVWGNDGKSYREYIQCKLTEPLQAGKEYQIGFFFKLSSYSRYKTDRVGMLLLDSALSLRRYKVFRALPTLSVIQTPKEEGEWDEAKMMYVAKGGEKFLVIGNFFDDHNTENIRLDYRKVKNNVLSNIAYFYIDDVSVIPADQVVSEPVVMTPHRNEEMFSLKNIQFDSNSDQLTSYYTQELDKLVVILKDKPQWKVELSGHTDDVGTDQFNRELSIKRAASVGEYLRSKGIASSRISATGLGETTLLVVGTDEYSRKINRRVEVQFVELAKEKQE